MKALLEQLHEPARDRRVPRQRLLDVALAEIDAGLAQHLAVKPQYRGLARREPGCQNEPVETIVLDRATPGRDQRLLEAAAQLGRERSRNRAGGDREFVHPDRLALDAVDTERLLGDNPEP